MYCMSCQTELPQEAVYCWKCGTPQKALVKVEPAPLVQRVTQAGGKTKESIIEVVGQRYRLVDEDGVLDGLLVIYGGTRDKEELFELYTEERPWKVFETLRMKERRFNGISIILAVGALYPQIYRLSSYGKNRRIMIEAGEVTEIDLR